MSGNTSAIDQYMTQYDKLTDALAAAADFTGALCRLALADRGIFATVTCRAKDSGRLRTKLENRLEEKRAKNEPLYKTVEDVENDLVDIIGVRVMLYFPSQVEEVEKIFARMFANADVKRMPATKGDPSKSLDTMTKLFQDGTVKKLVNETSNSISTGNYSTTFGGYRAIHIRCTVQPSNLVDEIRDSFTGTVRKLKTEIQIQSLLMHSWSEVNHDLAYKTLNGELSQEETRLLDFLNGIGQMGELALRKLKSILDARVKASSLPSDLPFASALKIAEFLRQFLNEQLKDQVKVFDLGDLEEFLYFITHHNLNDETILKQCLTECITKQKLDDTTIPIIGSLLDGILTGKAASTVLVYIAKDGSRRFRPFIRPDMNKALTGPRVQTEHRHEMIATVMDLTYRPLLQAAPAELEGCTFNRLLDAGLYAYPNISRYKGARFINREKTRDPGAREMIREVAAWFGKSKSPLVKYHIRIAQIIACKLYADAPYFRGLNF
ncbi:hypothetical protein AA313_de0206977 [Arthrobotrys entomopaga]|nr:hypothetical protein AA313_de0206977 [Arthrobotrys entomopaga]